MSNVKYGKIPNGISDIASYLGYAAQDVVFMHSTVIDPRDNRIGIQREQLDGFPLRYAQILGYIPRYQQQKNASAVILPVPPVALTYFSKCGLVNEQDVIVVGRVPVECIYPDISVAEQLYNAVLNNEQNLLKRLKGKLLVSSFLTSAEEKIVKLVGGKLLMTPKAQAKFSSKIYFRQLAKDKNFDVSPGVEITSIDELNTKISELEKIIQNESFGLKNVKLWLKLEAQSSGRGSITIDGSAIRDFHHLRELIIDFSHKHSSEHFLPFLVELDVDCLRNTKVVCNIGVQAVLSDKHVIMVGVTEQKTLDGHYIGSEINPSLFGYQKKAEQATLPAFQAIQQAGYRGYFNIDVLIAYNEKAKIYKAYSVDPNARFCGGTPLLSIVQFISDMTGKQNYGIMCSNFVKATRNVFQKAIACCAKDLYMGRATNYQGIIPFMSDEIFEPRNDEIKMTVIVVGDNMEGIQDKYSKYEQRISDL